MTNSFDATSSITICAFTTDPTEAPLFRLLIEPSEQNGLRLPSRLMVGKLTTMSKERLGSRLGSLALEDMVWVNRAMLVFLGMAGSSRT